MVSMSTKKTASILHLILRKQQEEEAKDLQASTQETLPLALRSDD